MDVGDWITEPELHARDRRGWGARWRLDSFSARLRFIRLGCAAAQIAVAKGEEVMKALPKKLLPLTLFGIAVTSDRKSTRLNSSHVSTSYAVFCWKKKLQQERITAFPGHSLSLDIIHPSR